MLYPEEGSQIASMSKEWIRQVERTARFEGSWNHSIEVGLTTLDALVDQYGMPAFCKIDVEGFEPEVLKGLSKPVRMLSFEYTPENSGHARACIDRLSAIGTYEFNIAIHHVYQLHFTQWLGSAEAILRFEDYSRDRELVCGGDVYCRLIA